MTELKRSQTGYTLVEVLVALAILIIGILGVLPLLALNVQSNTAARTHSLANFLAQEKLEDIKSWPYYSDQAANGPYGITANNTELFPSVAETIELNNYFVTFSRTAEVVRNGWVDGDEDPASGVDCAGILFGNSSGSINVNEGVVGGITLNTKLVNDKLCGSGAQGEDFRLVRVKVSWRDLFGFHEIVRSEYIAQF